MRGGVHSKRSRRQGFGGIAMVKPGKNAHSLSDLLKKVDEMEPENEVSAQVNSSFCLKNKIAAFTQSLSVVRTSFSGCAKRSFTSFGKTNVGKVPNVKLPKSLGEINPETSIEPQCQSALTYSKKLATFTKPNIGASDCKCCHLVRRGAAFTMAEVLVTLGIIGIVAAMTFPHLIEGYQKIVLQTQLKKFVNSFTRAYNQAVARYGDSEWWDNCKVEPRKSNCALSLTHEYIFENFSGIDCSKNIFSEKYKKEFSEANYIYAGNRVTSDWKNPSIVYCRLNDGTYLLYVFSSKSTYGTSFDIDTHFIVDINGSNGPNRYGKDIFGFEFYHKLAPGHNYDNWGVVEVQDPKEKMLLISGYGLSGAKRASGRKRPCGYLGSGSKRGSKYNLAPCQDELQKNGWEFPKNYPW